ncbi:DNA recombination protein RmuC [Candidatus Shapirobacteria bacterium]|nr:DNA recombination protein RmuC [Candidatus Shapirobacteria bacterium]
MNPWIPVLIVVVSLVGVAIYLERKFKNLSTQIKPDETLIEWLKSQQQDWQKSQQDFNRTLRSTNQNIQQVLTQSTQDLNKRLDNAAQYMSQVAKEVGQMSEIGRSMKQLQEFLQSPKLRGNIGEEVLKDLIGQMFPKNSFHLQYQFKTGDKVDAALKTEAGILPIDSKFPMENFRKIRTTKDKLERKRFKKQFGTDVRKHIKDIARKYVLPEEGTLDFALMYIPSEAVYYEVVNQPELIDFARHSRVYVVSPSTLYAILQTILLSFEGKKIEQEARQVFRLLRAIQQDYQKTETEMSVLGKHLGNAYSKMNEVFQRFSLLGQKISSATQLPQGEENKKIKS